MLKFFKIAMLSLLLVAEVSLGQAADVSGRWTATMERGGNTGSFVLLLEVADKRLTGTLYDPSGQTLTIENGKIDENQLTFDVVAQEHGHSKPIHFVGDVDTDQIVLRNQSKNKRGQTITFHRTAA